MLSPSASAASQDLPARSYVRNGGEASDVRTFVLRHPATVGITFVSSQVFAFRFASGARSWFQGLKSALSHTGTIGTVQQHVNVGATATPLPTIIKSIKHPVPPPPTLYETLAVPRIGQESAGFTNESAAYAGEFVFTNRVILFRQGRVCVVVHVSGDYDQVPVRVALSLSKIVDRRLLQTSK